MSQPRRHHPFTQPRATRAPAGDHRENALMHVQRRAWERLGVALTKKDVEALSAKCADGGFGRPGRTARDGRQLFGAVLRGHDVQLIFCPILGVVVTLYQRPLGSKKGDRI